MFRRVRYSKYAEPSLSGMTLRPSLERIIMRYTSVGLIAFLTTLLAFSIFTPVEVTDATTVLSALSAGDSSISISTSASTVNLSLSASSAGTVRTASDTVSVTAGNNGYQLYISTSGNTSALIRDGATSTGIDATTGAPTYADNDIIPTLTSGNNLIPITSPTNLENNTWGFAVPAKNTSSESSGSYDVVANGFDSAYPTGDSSVATSKFASVPTKGNDILIAKRSSSADAVPTNFYYGIKATSAQPSGLYQSTITYTAIGDSNTNGLASVTPERTNQLAGGVILRIATPSTLASASIASVNVTVGGNICTNATPYYNGDIYVNISCSSPALATGWHEVIANIHATNGTTETYVVNPGIEYYSDEATIASTMQDFDILQCNAMNTGQTAILKDSRDGKTYSIAKMADGNCWMTQNLRLGTPGQSITLTSADSDVTTDYTINSSDIQTTTGIDWSANANATHIYSFAENSDVSADNKIAYGNLYSWYTATASVGVTVIGGNDAPSSICPKGWKLSTNEGAGSFMNLSIVQSISTSASGSSTDVTNHLQLTPLSFVLAGYYSSDGDLNNRGIEGSYWSRTSHLSSSASAMQAYFNGTSGSFNLQSAAAKYSGRAVRCVFTMEMQNFSSVACANLDTGKSVTLIDSRDLNTYQVTKQADGNCWMTQNLRLGTTADGLSTQDVTLTTADSDLPAGSADYTITASTDILKTGDTYTDWSTSVNTTHVFSFAGTTNVTTYGNLYNWYTATAKTGENVTGGADAPGSLCPKGWKLPSNTGNSSYTNLIQAQIPGIPTSGTNTTYTNQFTKAPLSFARAGYYTSSNLVNQGDENDYWSRTSHPSSNGSAKLLRSISTTGVFDLQYSNYKYNGFSVRCVFAPAMQDFTTTVCNNLEIGKTISLTDLRDMKIYSTAKLDDEICRMTSNLRLGSSSPIKLTVNDTDLASTSVYDSGQDGWYTPAVQTSGYTSWSSPVDAKHIYQQSNIEYGNLYNWYAATAGTGLASMANDGDEASSSICPKGWKLPPNTGTGSYVNLTTAASIGNNSDGSTKIQNAPYSFPLAGDYYSGLSYQGTNGDYWSRTALSADSAHFLRVMTGVNPQNGNKKYDGRSLRCYFAN